MNKPQRRTAIVPIRLSDEEKLLIDKARRITGLSRSAFLRSSSLEKAHEITTAEHKPSPPKY